jgi:hypothetical protein
MEAEMVQLLIADVLVFSKVVGKGGSATCGSIGSQSDAATFGDEDMFLLTIHQEN